MVNKDYENKIITKYGSWENSINSNVHNFYKYIDRIDRGIVEFLKILNNNGCHTVFSCSGHSEYNNAYVDFATYVDKGKVLYEVCRLFSVSKNDFFLTLYKFP